VVLGSRAVAKATVMVAVATAAVEVAKAVGRRAVATATVMVAVATAAVEVAKAGMVVELEGRDTLADAVAAWVAVALVAVMVARAATARAEMVRA
jgi:hypothetical protein